MNRPKSLSFLRFSTQELWWHDWIMKATPKFAAVDGHHSGHALLFLKHGTCV